MKNLIAFSVLAMVVLACSTQKNTVAATNAERAAAVNDTVRIANDSLEYEIIIIDPGFNTWLAANARPRGFYSQSYLEGRNIPWVVEWNNRARQPQRYNPNLYEMQIDYRMGVDYGYEVNYLLYNYLVYFQITNKQKLGGFVPRI